jgi:hypothetical protein
MQAADSLTEERSDVHHLDFFAMERSGESTRGDAVADHNPIECRGRQSFCGITGEYTVGGNRSDSCSTASSKCLCRSAERDAGGDQIIDRDHCPPVNRACHPVTTDGGRLAVFFHQRSLPGTQRVATCRISGRRCPCHAAEPSPTYGPGIQAPPVTSCARCHIAGV